MKRVNMSVRTWVLCCALMVCAACRLHGPQGPWTESHAKAVAAKLERHLRRHPHDVIAKRDLAHVWWLYLGHTARALPVLDALARAGDPLAKASRIILARARLDHRTVQREAAAIVARASQQHSDGTGSLWDALAELGARAWVESLGSLPGDEDAFVRAYRDLPLEWLPNDVKQVLTSERAAIARKRNEPYRHVFDEQGCVRRWSVGAMEGTLGELELVAAANTVAKFDRDTTTNAASLACAVRVWNPTPHAGIRRMRSYLDVRGETVSIELQAQEAMRAYLDGIPIVATDRGERWPAKRAVVTVPVTPGVHQLDLHTVISGERAWVLARVVDGIGRPISATDRLPSSTRLARVTGPPWEQRLLWPAAAYGVEQPLYAPLRAYLGIEDALADGDVDRAEGLARGFAGSRFAEAAMLVADIEHLDRSRGKTASAARERQSLERALQNAPDVDAARLRLLELSLERGEQVEVVQQLEHLPANRLSGVEGQLLRWQAYNARGFEHLAEAALVKARALHPDACSVLNAERVLAQRLDNVVWQHEIMTKLARCGGTLELRAQHAQERGELAQARLLWEDQLTRLPDDTEAMSALAKLAVTEKRFDDVIAMHDKLLALNPFRVQSQIVIADALVQSGRPNDARARVEGALLRFPHSTPLREVAETVGLVDDLWVWRVDGAAIVADYRARNHHYEGVTEVLVLDRTVTRVYDNGGQRFIIHMIIELLSKQAIDRYGELDVSDIGRVLTLRSLKPDGTAIEPEMVPGKDGLSLRNLAIGDFVEYEYVSDREPDEHVPGRVDVPTFRFQSPDIPYHRSELVVVHSDAIRLEEERRNRPPELQRSKQGELNVLHWRADQVPRFGSEPAHGPLLDELPMVRLHTHVDLDRWLGGVALALRRTLRTNPELRALVHSIVRAHEHPRDRLVALWRWVLDNVEDGGGLSTSATSTLASRKGSKLMLLKAMLREAGIPAQLWFVRDTFGAKQLPGHPLLETYDTPMLAVLLPGTPQPIMVMTSSKVMPLGYLLPSFVRGAAIRVQLSPEEPASAMVTVPPVAPALEDRRSYVLAIDVDKQGKATLDGKITLQGLEAVSWREGLRQVDRDRIDEIFQQTELGRLFRGANLVDLSIEHEKRWQDPLVLRFRATVQDFAVRQANDLVLPSALIPMNLSRNYTGLPSRRMDLLVQYSPEQYARIELRAHGSALATIPAANKIESRFGRFERTVERGKVGESVLVLRLHSNLRTGVIPAEKYPELAAFAREVQAAEEQVIRLR